MPPGSVGMVTSPSVTLLRFERTQKRRLVFRSILKALGRTLASLATALSAVFSGGATPLNRPPEDDKPRPEEYRP